MLNNVNLLHTKDNVVTAVAKISQNSIVQFMVGGQDYSLPILESIPLGHKISISDIPKGGYIIKYGEVIGISTKDIQKGELVHIHNVESLRGRGDLK